VLHRGGDLLGLNIEMWATIKSSENRPPAEGELTIFPFLLSKVPMRPSKGLSCSCNDITAPKTPATELLMMDLPASD
jgi:hypothetical protein